MKKIATLVIALAAILLYTAFVINPVSRKTSQNVDVQKPIPADAMKFLEKSCMNCHSDQGNKMEMSVLNISEWEKYAPEKQAAKAKAMCNMVSKGKMPPKGFRKNNPDAVPTPEDSKLLCDWAESLQDSGK
jgi:hypothetical protein